MTRQTMRSGDNSQNIQAQVANFGISYSDARSIALDVFNDNFARLSEEARDLASERAEELTMKFLESLWIRNPEAISNVRSPGVQFAILEAQTGYAVTGDKELGDVLVDLLVDRTALTHRGVEQLTLEEALKVARKLTSEHFKALSLTFLAGNAKLSGPKSVNEIYDWMRRNFPKFGDPFNLTRSDLGHLASVGCLTPNETFALPGIVGILRTFYPGFYVVGFDRQECSPSELEVLESTFFEIPPIRPCYRDLTKFQVNAVTSEDFERLVAQPGLEALEPFLKRSFEALIPEGEVVEEVTQFDEALARTINNWDSSPIHNSSLSPIGITIAHANVRRVMGAEFDADLSIWVS